MSDDSLPYVSTRSRWWYLLPIFLGIIGGIMAYVALRNDDKKIAKNCLWIGIIITIVGVAINVIPSLFVVFHTI
jgi:hypothetical protein